MIDNKINKLKENIVSHANDIEKMLTDTIEGFLSRNSDILQRVKNKDEKKINEHEVKIDKLCAKIFALYQPEAKDLRTVYMISRMNSDLERMGDHCVNIAESSLYLIDNPISSSLSRIKKMAKETIAMLVNSINAFINDEVEEAINVCKYDSIIDDYNEKIFKEIIDYIVAHPNETESALNFLRIANNLEKIADLTTNLSEETIYIVSGKTIKHHQF